MGVAGPYGLSGERCAPGAGPSARRRATWAARRHPVPALQRLRPRLRMHRSPRGFRIGPLSLGPVRLRAHRPSPAPSGSPRAAAHPTTGCSCCTAAAAAVRCASARSFPAVSKGSPSSSRNLLAAAGRRIGAFWRGSVTLTEASPPRCRQELPSAPQESALAAHSPTGCRPVSQGAASWSSCSRPSPCMSGPPACSRALTPAAPTHTEGSQDCCSPWQPRSACSHNWPSPSLPGPSPHTGTEPHRRAHAYAPAAPAARIAASPPAPPRASAAGTDVFLSNCTKRLRKPLILLVGCLQLLWAKLVCAEPLAGGHGLQPARLACDVIGPQGVDRVEVPPAGADRIDSVPAASACRCHRAGGA